MDDEIAVRDFTREPSVYIDRVLGGESFKLTRYGKTVAILTGTTTTGGGTSITTQVEHEATDPRHRPAPEPLEVRNAKPTGWADRHPAQAATDAILGAARGRKRE